ncbi:MAG: hypothetical protein APF81_15720 [Desulfosporosinus sp. BRH_c37]|nr:MAG: hypothetical protein APF81_15720 [Desulfosporosinus sp. BRH_c37]
MTTDIVTPTRGKYDNVSVSQRIERLPLTSFQRFLSFCIFVVAFFDAVDMGAMNFLLPVLAKEFHLTSITTGLLGSIGLAGMLFGALVAGPLADKIGRKTVLMWSIVIWGIAGFGLAAAWNINSLLGFRFLLGLGLGASYPIAITLLPEFLPTQARGKYLTVLEGLAPIGVICAGLITALVLPLVSWRWVFVIEAVPSLWVFVIKRYVPESPRWLESAGRKEEANRIMDNIETEVQKRHGQTLPDIENTAKVEPVIEKASFTELWSKTYFKRTIMLWILWPATMFGYYGMNIWLTQLLVAKGFTIIKSINYVLLINLGAIPGVILTIYLIERAGRKAVLIVALIGTAFSAYYYGQATNMTTLISFGLSLNFFTWMMWPSIYAYTPELYPTRMRGTGCGMSSAVGRVGALAGPYVTGVILTTTMGQSMVFTVAAGTFILAALAVIFLGPETKGRTLEEVSS